MPLETEGMILSFHSLSHGEIPFLEGGNESSGIALGRKICKLIIVPQYHPSIAVILPFFNVVYPELSLNPFFLSVLVAIYTSNAKRSVMQNHTPQNFLKRVFCWLSASVSS